MGLGHLPLLIQPSSSSLFQHRPAPFSSHLPFYLLFYSSLLHVRFESERSLDEESTPTTDHTPHWPLLHPADHTNLPTPSPSTQTSQPQRTKPPTRAARMEKIQELLKESAAILESIELNCEKSIIDLMLMKYDCQKMRQYLRIAMEVYARGDAFGKEDPQRIMSESTFKADILADAEICVAGLRDDRDIFISLYNQEPERALEYRLHYVLRLLEYHSNLCLPNRTITPEVEKLHLFFIRTLLLSGFLSNKELEPSVREHSYEYWRAVGILWAGDEAFCVLFCDVYSSILSDAFAYVFLLSIFLFRIFFYSLYFWVFACLLFKILFSQDVKIRFYIIHAKEFVVAGLQPESLYCATRTRENLKTT